MRTINVMLWASSIGKLKWSINCVPNNGRHHKTEECLTAVFFSFNLEEGGETPTAQQAGLIGEMVLTKREENVMKVRCILKRTSEIKINETCLYYRGEVENCKSPLTLLNI